MMMSLWLVVVVVVVLGSYQQHSVCSFTLSPSTLPITRLTVSHERHLKQQQQQQRRQQQQQQQQQRRPLAMPFLAATSSDTLDVEDLYSKYCKTESGWMTKDEFRQIPYIAELLADGDVLQEELDDIWKSVTQNNPVKDKIDRESFVQIYSDIDDLFEDIEEEDKEKEEDDTTSVSLSSSSSSLQESLMAPEEEEEAAIEKKELTTVFQSLQTKKKKDTTNVLTQNELQEWDEIQTLLNEGLLGTDELDTLWETNANLKTNTMDIEGFLNFNRALDQLFEFADDDDDDDDDEEEEEEEVLDVRTVFDSLKDKNDCIGMEELLIHKNDNPWVQELNEMIADGDLSTEELETIYNDILGKQQQQQASSKKKKNKQGNNNKLTFEGFTMFYNEIENLFEYDDGGDDDDDDSSKGTAASTTTTTTSTLSTSAPEKTIPTTNVWKEELLRCIDLINEDTERRLPCGLEAEDKEIENIQNIVTELEMEPSNILRQKLSNDIDDVLLDIRSDLAGTWELLYTSSSAMKFNQGLSGIGGSFPNGKFSSLKQILKFTKFTSDVEYIEHIAVGGGSSKSDKGSSSESSASFDVRINGDWELRTSISLFTGEPSIVLTIVPERVTYGPTSTRADHWKSLGPTNMLDITYLDTDLRIMRGNTSTDTIFVFKKI